MIKHLLVPLVILFSTTASDAEKAKRSSRPNIILILADDMGIDSIAALNPKNPIPTPHLDSLLGESILFSDAHSGSAVCTPTRYGILTGRYAWRSRLKRGIVSQWERPLIDKKRLTLPGMLKKSGYHTACIGKWHLGWNWPKKGGGITERGQDVDFRRPVNGGPIDRGFDYYFGDDVPNWPPYVWIENSKTQGVPQKKLTFPAHYSSGRGIGMDGWKLESVLPSITQKSVEYIHQQSKSKSPFFLYLSLTSPHTPIAPSAAFKGKSGISAYADFLMETDWSVGQILKALDDSGIADNTLVIFTADNGTSPKCHFGALKKKNVDLQNHWRGMKADAFEGGHRVPLIIRWPGEIKPKSESKQIVSLVDLMATCAEVAGQALPDNAAEDSVSLLPVLQGKSIDSPLHQVVICHSISGAFVVRKGKWKLLYCPGSAGWSSPKDAQAKKQGLPKWQLYDLSKDPKESNNLIQSHPEMVEAFTKLLRQSIEQGRSTPGKPQKNHANAIWWKELPWEKP